MLKSACQRLLVHREAPKHRRVHDHMLEQIGMQCSSSRLLVHPSICCCMGTLPANTGARSSAA